MKLICTTFDNTIFAFKYIYKIKKSYILLLLLSTILSAVESIYSIVILKLILDYLVNSDFSTFIGIVILVFTLSFVLDSSTRYIDTKLIYLRKIIIEQITNLEIFQAVSVLDLKCYDETESYDNIFFNLSQGYENLICLLQNSSLLLSRILSVLGIVSIIGNYEWSILLVIIIFVIINSCLNILNAKLSFKRSVDLIPSLRGLDYIRRIFYLKQYASEIRVFGFFKLLKAKYSNYTKQRYEITKKYVNYELLLSCFQTALQLIMQIIVILTLAYNYFRKKIIISDFLIVYNSILELNDYISSVVNTFPEFYKNSLYIKEFRNLLNTESFTIKQLDKVEEIELQNISFNYNDEYIVIDNLNLKLEKGKRYAIIGSNGTGKSTLLKIISGLYDPTSGMIRINGKPLNNKKQLVRECSINFQDHQYYATSIAENILSRSCKLEDETAIWDILKDVGLYKRVKQLPLGIHTVLTQELDDSGTTFSGGEIERLAIARTLINKKSIMIFDEPTSALDASSIKPINELIFNKCKDSILIYVTHDLSIVEEFDTVIDLSQSC